MLTATAGQIINEALEQLGVLGEGETATAAQVTSSLTTLNMLTKTWQADGLHLFAVQNQYLFTNLGKRDYTLSPTTTDLVYLDYNITTTTVATSGAGSTVVLTSVADCVPGQQLGLLNSTTIVWYTIQSVNTGTLTVTLTTPVSIVLQIGTQVYLPTLRVQDKPLKLLEAYVIDPTGNTNLVLDVNSRIDQDTLSTLTTTGSPNQVYFNPQISYANINMWPFPQNEGEVLKLVVQRDLDINTTSTTLVDYPSEWFLPLAMNLAKLLSPKYGIPQMDYQRIALHAKELYETARGFDQETETSLFFSPFNQGR